MPLCKIGVLVFTEIHEESLACMLCSLHRVPNLEVMT